MNRFREAGMIAALALAIVLLWAVFFRSEDHEGARDREQVEFNIAIGPDLDRAAEPNPVEEMSEQGIQETIPEPPALEEAAPPIGVISGRVYDSETGDGISKVQVAAVPGLLTRAAIDRAFFLKPNANPGLNSKSIPIAESDQDGVYRFENLSLGQYTVAIASVEGYSHAEGLRTERRVFIADSLVELHAVDFPLRADSLTQHFGIIEGQVLRGGEPLRNTTVRISALPFSADLWGAVEIPAVRTDDAGRFKATNIAEFDGFLVPTVNLPATGRQTSVRVPVVVRNFQTTYVSFEFLGGTATFSGRIYVGDMENPHEARLEALYSWIIDGHYNDELIYTSTDADGNFRIENLAAGHINLLVRGPGVGTGKATRNFEIADGQDLYEDIVIGTANVYANIFNIPEGTAVLYVTASEGTLTQETRTWEQYLAKKRTQVEWRANRNPTTSEWDTVLGGLNPGTYTIIASSWPTRYRFEEVEAMGWDDFFDEYFEAAVFITIEEPGQELTIDIEFADVR